MINYDKLEKIGEYKDGSLTWFTDKESNVVYLIRIDKESYIGSTTNIRRRFSQYVADLTHGKYAAPRVQDAFNNIESFTIYVLERVHDASALRTREQFYIDLVNPTLNSMSVLNIPIKYNTNKENKGRFRILELCKEAGINQTELAEKIGLSRVGLSKAINGNPTVDTLERIATALNVPIMELFNVGTSEELTALIQYKADFYKASTIEELKKIVAEIEENH